MFAIGKHREIKISRGEDSGEFSVVVYSGEVTGILPKEHTFIPAVGIVIKPEQIKIEFNKEKFKEKIVTEKIHIFSYIYAETGELKWYLDDEKNSVDIEDYGINIISGELNVSDVIAVSYLETHQEEIYLSIFDINANDETYYVKKTFRSGGEIISEYRNE